MPAPEDPSPYREGEPRRDRDRGERDRDDRDREDAFDRDEDDDRPRRRRRREEPRDIGDDAGMRMLLPVGRSVWAIIAGYLGLFSLLCLPAPFAVLTGILAIIDIRKSNGKKHGMGRAIFGIVMGVIGTAFLGFGLIAAFMSRR